MLRPALIAALLCSAAMPVAAQNDAGSYLAGRAAQQADDFAASVRYLGRSLRDDPANVQVRESLIGANISLMDFATAADLSRTSAEDGTTSQIAALALQTADAQAGDWQGILDALSDGQSVGPLWDSLIGAWALIGEGRTEDGLAAFDDVAGDQSVAAYGTYHKALALAALGRMEEAATILDAQDGRRLTRRGLAAKAEILSQLGRTDDALAALTEGAGPNPDPALQDLIDRLSDGETLPYTVAPDAVGGMAELAFDIAGLVAADAPPSYALLYSRIAEHLRPSHTDAQLLSAMLLENMGQHDLASRSFGAVSETAPAYRQAQLGQAQVMLAAGQEDAALETMRALAEEDPQDPMVLTTLADTLRELGRFEEAREVYTDAIDLFETEAPGQWVVYFARAITNERTDRWDAASADFQMALDLNPGQAAVLNYYGYSLVEREERLSDALAMIEEAAEARPDSGAIIDSLGWARYRLGQYQEAVAPMERAVELMPVDPVINDHLGDVLWAVGRRVEARFQWQRALSFIDDDTPEQDIDADRVRRKLEVGLDEVLAGEGAPPIELSRADEG